MKTTLTNYTQNQLAGNTARRMSMLNEGVRATSVQEGKSTKLDTSYRPTFAAMALQLVACVFLLMSASPIAHSQGPAKYPKDGPAIEHKRYQNPLKELGVSGSNGAATGNALCYAGTLGALVEDNQGSKYILSNAHVLALDVTNGDEKNEPIVHAAGLDTAGCPPTVGARVATLTKIKPIDFVNANKVDAGIAKLDGDFQTLTGVIRDVVGTVGQPISPADAYRVLVAKSGRSTGFTCGQVAFIGVTAAVDYDGSEADFEDLIVVAPVAPNVAQFLAAGDSGSLIVRTNDQFCTGVPAKVPQNNAVGLLFAGNESGSIALANPICDVFLDPTFVAFGLRFPGTKPCQATGAPSNPQLKAAFLVKENYDHFLMNLPEVVGNGIGLSESGSEEVVIKVFLRKATDEALQSLPTILDGTPVEWEVTGPFKAGVATKTSPE